MQGKRDRGILRLLLTLSNIPNGVLVLTQKKKKCQVSKKEPRNSQPPPRRRTWMHASISGVSLPHLWTCNTWSLKISMWLSPGSKWQGWVSAFHSFPSLLLLSRSSVLGSREHLFNSACPLQDRAGGQVPPSLPEGIDW